MRISRLLLVCGAALALGPLAGRARAYDQHFDYTSFETGFGQAQFDVLNYPSINGNYMMTSTDNHRPEMVANGNALAEFYNNFNADYNHPTAERRTPTQEAAHIDAYTRSNSTKNGARPEWLILNEISSSQWQLNPGAPSKSEHRTWVIDTVTLLNDVYGYKVITYSPYETVGTANAASWQALAAKSYIGIESYQSGTEVWNSGANNASRLAWVQGKYQSSKNTYLAAGVSESRLFISEHFANNNAVTDSGIAAGWGRAGLASASDWDQVIMLRQDAMKNVGFAGFLAYNWGGNGMGVTQAEQIQHEYYYRSRLVLPSQKPQWLSNSAINVNGTVIPLSWSQPLNWKGGVPNAVGAEANFWKTLSANRIITLDGSKTVGTLTFNSPFNYTISAGTGGSLILNHTGAAATLRSSQGSHAINAAVQLLDPLSAEVETGTFSLSGPVTGTGGLTKSGAGTLAFNATASYTGATTIAAGALRAANGMNSGGAVEIHAGGRLEGGGDVRRSVENNGLVAGPTTAGQYLRFTGENSGDGDYLGNVAFASSFTPGEAPVSVSLGNVLLEGTNTLAMEIAGLQLGAEYDHLDVAGAITFGGQLSLSLTGGFTPQPGDAFDLFNWATASGAFSSLALPALPGRVWDASQLHSSGTLSVFAAGDFDQDGTVDEMDRTNWKAGYGAAGNATHLQGDADGDRDVDGADFLIWQRQLGSAPGAAASVVPEPASFLLLAVGVLAGMLRRSRGAYAAAAMALAATPVVARGEDANGPPAERGLASVQEMIDARTDVWGAAARAQPNGASYEFFKDLLPPLRWVNTTFRHYPIVMISPRGLQKARLVSNGSAVNARANKPPMWHEEGTPVAFFVGETAEPFGEYQSQLEGPNYLDGFLPIVAMRYRHEGLDYRQEAFAPVDAAAASHGATLLRFSLAEDAAEGGAEESGRIEARFTSETPLRAENGDVLDENGECVAAFSPSWEWDAERAGLTATLRAGQTAELAIFTKASKPGQAISSAQFDERKRECVETWTDLVDGSINVVTPETMVNDAWRSMLIGSLMLAVEDRLHYSAGNAYAKLYQGECGDTLRSMMLFGRLEEAPAMLKPLLAFNREATQFHVAGHKLQLLAHFYWLTRDAETVRDSEPLWRPSVELILTSREPETGLLPKDNYAGDINEKVYSLNSNANCWRGLRDVAAMLEDMGAADEAESLRAEAAAYREVILDAVARSERLDTEPPFLPLALLSDEPAHDPLTATRTGSYYNLMCPYTIGSEIFGQGSDREDWLLGYLENHGAISMGMIRSTPHVGQFKGEPGVNPLYGLRYQLALLRRDEREKALTGFYGQLAQGMTRGTFIGGEGSRFRHGDAAGRSFYLPPNSTSNGAWMVTLRYLLVQDWDLDEDAKPETLRLLFAAPRRWLMDGEQIRIENAPTMFGPVSCRADSKLKAGYVDVWVTPPPRPVKTLLLRAPLPEGWHVDAVEVDGAAAELIDGDAVNLSGRTKPLIVRFAVKASTLRSP